ncbi:hypothetical protein ACHAXA_011461 [Cyclostephanos tholiformis]|uniref:RAP domain-containing protein n=1 Tax=Cyclostephanos tholiformis TaxID=382380 RepID=A0ABD3SE73_9STRA
MRAVRSDMIASLSSSSWRECRRRPPVTRRRCPCPRRVGVPIPPPPTTPPPIPRIATRRSPSDGWTSMTFGRGIQSSSLDGSVVIVVDDDHDVSSSSSSSSSSTRELLARVGGSVVIPPRSHHDHHHHHHHHPPPPANARRGAMAEWTTVVTGRRGRTTTTTTSTTSGNDDDDDDDDDGRRRRKRGYLRPGMYDGCRNIGDLARTGHVRLDDMTPRDLSSFWTLASRMMIAGDVGLFSSSSSSSSAAAAAAAGGIIYDGVEANRRLCAMLDRTLERIHEFGPIPLAETALGFARISKCVRDHGGDGGARDSDRHPRGDDLLLLRDAFYDDPTRVFGALAEASMHTMNDVDPRVLSNLAYSFGLAGIGGRILVPFEDGERTILDVLAYAAIAKLRKFNSQDLSNMLWAYSNVKLRNHILFRAAGDVIVARDNLRAFRPQEISSILWSYASLGESHPALFDMVEGHILAHNRDGSSYCELLGPRALSNVVSSYAISGEGRRRRRLFDVVANYIVSRGDEYLDEFAPRDLSNLMWAYATAGMSHPSLFDAVSIVAVRRRNDFTAHQSIANMLWAYSSIGRSEKRMFVTWIPTVLPVLRGCDVRSLTSIAWAYSVANIAAPSLFGPDFLYICHEKWTEFDVEGKRQLYQWHLWQEELNSDIRLPPSLEGECYQAFLSTTPTMSALQGDVISELVASGLRPDCEVLTKRGYRLDAIVEVNGKKVGIEVDGPSHFVGRNLTGNAVLKRRHVTGLEGTSLVSVPYWEWNAVKNNRGKRRQYLSALLDLNR